MVEPGQIAVIHFTGRIAEGDAAGEVFDTTDVDVALEEGIYHDHRDYKPLQVRVGEEKILPGIDRALQGMEAGERRTVELDPDAAFGERSDDRVVNLPIERLEPDDGAAIESGNVVHDERGRTGWILEVDAEAGQAVVDFNHELAGTTIECELHVLEVRSDPGGTDEADSDERSFDSEPDRDGTEAA